MDNQKKWDNSEIRDIIIDSWDKNDKTWNDVKNWAKEQRPEEYKEAEKKAEKVKRKKEKNLLEDKKIIKQLDNLHIDGQYRISFNPSKITINKSDIENLARFCYGIKVKETRSGGTNRRSPEKKKYDNLQGKLAEIIIYNLYNSKYNFEEIDFNLYELGEWDSVDLKSRKYEFDINVKSGLKFHNLLLLAKKDYDDDGNYKHHNNTENYEKQLFSYVRLKLDKDKITEMLSKNVDDFIKWFLEEYQTIEYDLFFCDIKKVQCVIKNNNLIREGNKLNGKEKMDADNYYVLLYNMFETIDELI